MNTKHIRMPIDISMTILSVVLMGGTVLFADDRVHQILGMVLLGLWAVHTVLNHRWYGSIFRGRYNAYRIMQTIVNIGITLCAVLLFVSGMSMAWFMPVGIGLGAARIIHLVSSHWYYIFMAFHLGMHISMIFSTIKINRFGKIPNLLILIVIILICGYGIFAFIIRGVWKYMFGVQQFFFLDLDRGYVLFAIDYVAILVLLAAVSHFVTKTLVRTKIRESSSQKQTTDDAGE